jgi:hypothetical protein
MRAVARDPVDRQLEEAANHIPHFPAKFKTWAEALGEHGSFTGLTAERDRACPGLLAG